MQTAASWRFVLAALGLSTSALAGQAVLAEPITSPVAMLWAEPEGSAVRKHQAILPGRTATADPAQFIVTPIERKPASSGAAGSNRPTSPKNSGDSGTGLSVDGPTTPDIPWEAIELEILSRNLAAPNRNQPEIVIDREYRQLIVEALPDFAFDVAFLQRGSDIPLLDVLRAQSTALSMEIIPFASDLASEEPVVAMASNGNLDSDAGGSGEVAGEELVINGSKPPSLLRRLLYWGLGLLVLYSLLEALYHRLRRHRSRAPAEQSSAPREGEPVRPRRRRSFRRRRMRRRTAS